MFSRLFAIALLVFGLISGSSAIAFFSEGRFLLSSVALSGWLVATILLQKRPRRTRSESRPTPAYNLPQRRRFLISGKT